MKIAVIGCTHAGTAAILNAVKLYPQSQITVYERNDNISFLSCGIALHVGGIVKDQTTLFYCSPEKLAALGVNTHMKHDVTAVDFNAKIISVKNLVTGAEFTDSYDKLIITTGSWPICPKIENVTAEGILLCKNFDHSNDIVKKAEAAKNIVVIGAGYIGVELVEAFEQNGKNVTLIDSQDRILNRYFDAEFTDLAENSMTENKIRLALAETVQKFEVENNKVSAVVTDKNRYEADLVIMSVGFKPNTALFKDQLKMLPNGAIVIDEFMQTSQPDVFAAGDCCAIHLNPSESKEYIPLATNAVRMGTLVAHNLVKPKLKHPGTQGTSAIKIYEYNFASTGLTLTAAIEKELPADSVVIDENYRPEFMPDYEMVKLKLVYNPISRVILGAQLVSKADLTQSINTMSVAIQNKMTIEDLAFVDLFFQPHYNKPWNFINSAALAALGK